jgi:sialic acid synthase SpsE
LGLERIISQLSEQFGKERVIAVMGDGVKRLAPAEEANYGRTNRSLHFMHDMKAGQIIGEGDVAVLRTEKVLTPGLTPDWLDKVIGAKLVRDVTSGAGVQKEDFL